MDASMTMVKEQSSILEDHQEARLYQNNSILIENVDDQENISQDWQEGHESQNGTFHGF